MVENRKDIFNNMEYTEDQSRIIQRDTAATMIAESNGLFFTVEFFKLNGDYRILNGRLGVKKGVKNRSVDRVENRFTIYDVQNHCFRTVRLESIVKLKINGKRYTVIP
jgi:hypothetical protein